MPTPNPEITFNDYKGVFVQRIPSYAVKMPGHTWRTKKKALSDLPVLAHLQGKYSTGVLSKYYPEFCTIDIDKRDFEEVERIRETLSLDERSSMLCKSESERSYHLLFRPEYGGEPPTTNLLQSALKEFATIQNIEVFPKVNKAIRLPFGPGQDCLDFEYQNLTGWESQLFWFNKLDSFDLAGVRGHQLNLNLKGNNGHVDVPTVMQQAQEYLKYGLQMPSSREYAQFVILLSLFRQNVLQKDAESIVWNWIQTRSNGYSKDFLRFPLAVKKHIQRQAQKIWSDYSLNRVYPDRTHNQSRGYITKPDINEILKITGASIPRSKLLFGIVKYIYPDHRRYKDWVPIRTQTQWRDRDKGYGNDTLRDWGGRLTVPRYLNEFEEKGILKRQRFYIPGKVSMSIKLNWDFKINTPAVLYEGRAINSWEDTIRCLMEPSEFREMLRGAGATRQAAYRVVTDTYRGNQEPLQRKQK